VIGPDGAVRSNVTTDERIAELAVAGPRALASTSGAHILDWGTFPIAGRPRHGATIVREASDHQVIGYLIEVAPGSVVEVIVSTDGFRTRPDYTAASDTEPGWATRCATTPPPCSAASPGTRWASATAGPASATTPATARPT